MINLKLDTLKLENFKGIKSFELKADCGNVDIFGDNATGKTTIFDAVVWLLFGKNSEDKKDFGIKTIVDNEEIHHAEHSVEATFKVYNYSADLLPIIERTFTLKKVFKEKWVKNRGKLEAEFSGHTTECYIDDVPKKATEYKGFVDSIVSESVFKLLTDPLYFNEKLDWQSRRKMLMKLCGDITNEEVFKANPELAELKELLGNRTLEDFKAMVKASQSKTKKNIENIAPAINENIHNMADIKNEEAISEAYKKALEELEKAKDELSHVQYSSSVQDEIDKLTTAKNKEELELKTQEFQENKKFDDMELAYKREALVAQEQVNNHVRAISELKTEISERIAKRENLLSEFNIVKLRTFEEKEIETVCPYCNQPLPEAQVEEVRANQQKEIEKFNFEKASKLKEIQEAGKANTTDKELAESQLESYTEYLKKYNADLERINNLVDDLELNKSEVRNKYRNLLKESLEKYDKKIKDCKAKLLDETKVSELKAVINSKEDIVREAFEQVKAVDSNKKLKERNKELEAQEKELSIKFADLSRQLYMADEFTRAKTELVDKAVSEKFELAHFKLFKNNISNDGIEECCEACINGVPYSDLNNAAKINCGLDIIRTLAKDNYFEAPVVIDNAESVTELVNMGTIQVIRLIVSKKDKNLRVEKGE